MKKRRRPVRQPLRKPQSASELARARRLYERTRMPVNAIAASLGIDVVTFYRRVAREGWMKRRDNPQLQPPFSISRSRRARFDVPPVEESVFPTPSASRAETIARLDALAARHAEMAAAVHRRFVARGGPRVIREEQGFARLIHLLRHSRSLLAEIS